jgi:hypothetical protein
MTIHSTPPAKSQRRFCVFGKRGGEISNIDFMAGFVLSGLTFSK